MPEARSKIVGTRVKLRRATLRDLDVLVKQRRGMWSHWVRVRLKNGEVVGWIAETGEGDAAAGAIVWLRPSVSQPGVRHQVQPYLLSMYTDPKWRRRGLASRIVGEAMKWAKRKGYTEIRLHASPNGKRIYIRRGFKRTWEMKRKL